MITTNPNINTTAQLIANRRFRLFFAELKEFAPFGITLAIFIFFGLTGHDPWKADEAYIFGIVHSMLEDNSWLVPLVAGEPFMEKPPLYAWVAAYLVQILSRWFNEPDAARLTSGLFMAVTVWAVAAAANNWWGKGVGRYAALALASCIGLLVQSHMMMPDIPLITGFALALWGFSLILLNSFIGGALIGLGVGISFLAKGILGPAVIGVLSVLLPLCFKQWRMKKYFIGLSVAFIATLPMLIVWPVLLYLRSPDLFFTWFWDNNFGRYFGSSVVSSGTEHLAFFWTKTLPWFTFPALPFAIKVLFSRRKQISTHSGLQCTLLMSVVIFVVLATSASVRAVYAFPLLVPLAVLASPSVFEIRAVPDSIFSYSSKILFWAIAGLIWLVWLILMFTHSPPNWAWLRRVLPADFLPLFDPWTLILAAALTCAAIWASIRFGVLPGKGLTSWFTGLTLVWALISTLWMPWLNYAKSYRQVFESIPWPASHHCVASIGLGESERAMLDYFADRLTLRREISSGTACDLLFIQGYATTGLPKTDIDRWKLRWSGARPGDTWQKFWLFQKRNTLRNEKPEENPTGDIG